MDVKEPQIVDGEAGQSVADARVQHEHEAVLGSKILSGGDPDDHRAGYKHGTRGENNVEGEDEEVFRTVEIHRQDDRGVIEHPGAPQEVEHSLFIGPTNDAAQTF